jgi:hypothetical protein
LSFSNLYITSNLNVTRAFAVDVSIDARKNVRNYNTMDTPDSLFDNGLNRGIDGGMTISLSRNATLRGRAGSRYREGGQNVQFASINLNMRQFIRPGYYLTARVSRSKTEFTTAYAPLITVRFPLGRRTRLGVGGGAYLYDTSGLADDNYYLDARADRPMGSRYTLSVGARHYFGGTLESLEINTELGVNF